MNKINIVTYGAGYEYYVYIRFIESLYKTGFSGNLYIVIRTTDIDKITPLKDVYSKVHFCVDTSPIDIMINNHRYFVIRHMLSEICGKSEYIFWTDFRDVLFQKNIEDYVLDDTVDLYGFLEDIKINQDLNYNTPWIQHLDDCLKEEIYDTINDNYVICSGTTLCKSAAFKLYIERMCDVLLKTNVRQIIIDQGIHNYFLYLKKLDVNIKLLSNEDNFVNTVGCGPKILDDDSNIVNIHNEVSYVVHQYDRFDEGMKHRISQKHKLCFF